MTRMDRFICLFIEPYCRAEETARRVLLWVADKALDWHLCKLSRVMSDDDE